MNHGIDKYRKPQKLSASEEQARLKRLTNIRQENYNELWKTLPIDLIAGNKRKQEDKAFLEEPEENLLYFLEKNAPQLATWKREIIRIIRKVAQYFYPQGMTKVMNEGFATFMHYHIINEMFEQGYLDDGFMLEFLHSHSSVIFQPEYDSKYFSGLNPYTLGFNIFMDIKRICQEPTKEDKEWFPNLMGKNWLDEVHYAMENFRDDSFILQYLSPKVIRDMRLFTIADYESEEEYEIAAIHNEKGYRKIREDLSEQYKRSRYVPDIQVVKVDRFSNQKLHLLHQISQDKRLEPKDAENTLEYIKYLWEFPVELISRNKLGINEEVYQCE
jgi:spore cortex formation protein SpoVR/YcgB (stage V sporulation)